MKYKDDLNLENLYKHITNFDGSIDLDKFKGDTRDIESCEGSIICHYSKGKVDLSNLKYVRGKIDFKEAGVKEIDLSSLENVGTGGINIRHITHLNLPSLRKCHGSIVVENAKTLNIPNLEYSHWISSKKIKDFEAPRLTSCAGLYLQGANTLKAPVLVTCEGNIDAPHVTYYEFPILKRVRDINLAFMETIELDSIEFLDRFDFKNASSVSMKNLARFHNGNAENAETINMPNLGMIGNIFKCQSVKKLELPSLATFYGEIVCTSAELIDVKKLNRGSLAGKIYAKSAKRIYIPESMEGEQWLINKVFQDLDPNCYVGNKPPFEDTVKGKKGARILSKL